MKYAPAFDGLRAAAVLAVIAYHAGRFPQGYRGVDLFFLLSGFLITCLLVAEYDRHGAVSLRSFYARRALRLLPALALVLVVVGSTMFVADPSWRTAGYLAGVASYLGNYVIGWHGIGSPLDHFWSLAVEEQFYLVWPLVLLGLLRLPRPLLRWMLTTGASLALLAVALGAPSVVAHPLALGAVLAFLPVPTFGLASRVLSVAPLVWIGRRSYGLYLWHFPVFYALGDPWHETYPIGTAVFGLAVTITLAAASFHFLELPALVLKARLPRWTPKPIGFAWLVPVAIMAAVVLVYLPTLRFGWIETYDDAAMLLNNANLLSWNPAWAFQHLYFGHWMPLTWITWTIDAHAWGLWAGGWHAINVALHAVSAGLLYLIARRLLGSRLASSAVALVWALHPLRLESVAWISERKDCLSGFFALLSVWLYLRFVDRQRQWHDERVTVPIAAVIAFGLAVMAKSIAVVVVPFIMLLDWSVLHRRAWLEKVPFLVIAIAVSVLAFVGIHVGITNLLPWNTVGLGPRLLVVAYSFVFYIQQTLWPSRMSHMIEYTWAASLDQPQYPIAVGLVLLVAVACLMLRRRRWLMAGILGYAVAIFPQSGLFHNGAQLVANRYTYLATVPLVLLAGAGLARLQRRRAVWAWTVAMLVVAALIGITHHDLPMWTGDDTLQTYAAESEPTCIACQNWAAIMAVRRGDVPAARRYLERGLAIAHVPTWMRHGQLWAYGAVLEYLGDRGQAAAILREYLASQPDFMRDYPSERVHMDDARVRLARLEAR